MEREIQLLNSEAAMYVKTISKIIKNLKQSYIIRKSSQACESLYKFNTKGHHLLLEYKTVICNAIRNESINKAKIVKL